MVRPDVVTMGECRASGRTVGRLWLTSRCALRADLMRMHPIAGAPRRNAALPPGSSAPDHPVQDAAERTRLLRGAFGHDEADAVGVAFGHWPVGGPRIVAHQNDVATLVVAIAIGGRAGE